MDEMNPITWLRAGTDETLVRGRECPGEEDLAAFVDGRLATEGSSRLRDHLAACDHCLHAVAFLSRNAELEPAANVPASLAARARDGRFSRDAATSVRAVRYKAAAAVFVAVTTIVIWNGPGPGPGEDATVRSLPPSDPTATEAAGGPQLLFPASGAMIRADAVELRWTLIPTAVSYEVRVVTLDGDVVWEQRVFGTEARLPAEVRLLSGEPYLVRISAQLPGGKTLESEHVRFFVRDP